MQQDQAIRQLEVEQLQRERELHYRQNQNVPPASPMDDEGTRRAKGQMEQRAQQESRRQMQRFDWEMEQARRRNSAQ